jgi:hypothetical protein
MACGNYAGNERARPEVNRDALTQLRLQALFDHALEAIFAADQDGLFGGKPRQLVSCLVTAGENF